MDWVCPQDRHELTAVGDALRCSECGRRYPAAEGIANFLEGEAGGVDPDPALGELWAMVREHGAESAAGEFATRHGYTRTPFTADWKLFLPTPEGSRVLELGAGFGDDTLDLAARGADVLSIVPNRTNALILEAHVRERGLANVRVGVRTDITRMPLADRSIDAIAMEDVAGPGFGVSGRSLPRLAAEWRRLLRPGGVVVLGLGNPLTHGLIHMLLGSMKTSRSRTESFNRFVKRAGQRRSRTWLWRATVAAEMAGQGFRRPTLYSPLPDEQKTLVVVPSEQPQVLRYFLQNLVRQNSTAARVAVRLAGVLTDAGLLHHVLPYHFLIFKQNDAERS